MEIKLEKIKLVEFTQGVYSVYTSRDVLLGTFELDIDGFYYYWENKRLEGSWRSHSLRLIADKLDEVNKPYEDSINEYFKNKDNTGDLTLEL